MHIHPRVLRPEARSTTTVAFTVLPPTSRDPLRRERETPPHTAIDSHLSDRLYQYESSHQFDT